METNRGKSFVSSDLLKSIHRTATCIGAIDKIEDGIGVTTEELIYLMMHKMKFLMDQKTRYGAGWTRETLPGIYF